MPSDARDFVLANTVPAASPLIPEIKLHLATEVTPLWQATEAALERHQLPPPYWAFAWAGGQALARHLLDHPELVAGRRVLDFGADEAAAILFYGATLQHAQRLGKLEKLERAEGFDLGLRVIIGKRQAIVSSNDRDADHSRDLIGRAIEMAKTVPEDPFCGLADPTDLARKFPALDLEDPVEPSPAILAERAGAAEDAANAIKGVTNSEGAQASWSRSVMALVASNGFAGRYGGTNHSIVVSVLAGAAAYFGRRF